jgi:hypothetical protein
MKPATTRRVWLAAGNRRKVNKPILRFTIPKTTPIARDRIPSAGTIDKGPALKGETIVEAYQLGTAKKSQTAFPISYASPLAPIVVEFFRS